VRGANNQASVAEGAGVCCAANEMRQAASSSQEIIYDWRGKRRWQHNSRQLLRALAPMQGSC
jgi:hypothetical protein